MKQSDISQQLGDLIGKTGGNVYGNSMVSDNAIPSELEDPVPSFEIDHKSEIQKSRLEAAETIKYIVRAVVPEEYQSNPAIHNQMKIDSIQLGMLYYQQNMNNILLEDTMNNIAKGDSHPRMYECSEKFIKRSSDLADTITNLHAQFRKYYIDTYLDIESKQSADEEDIKNLHITKKSPEFIDNYNEPEGIEKTESGGMKIIGTKSMNIKLTEERKKKFLENHKDDVI